MIKVKLSDPYDSNNGAFLKSEQFTESTKVIEAAKSILKKNCNNLAFVCNGCPILAETTLSEVKLKLRKQDVPYLMIRCLVRHIGGSE